MHRRLFLILLVVAALSARQPLVAADRPNIVIILADDLGYGDLGCYGHPRFKTPHLDKMAAEGARLTQFNTPMPFCAPTRASLLTGRYPFRCGMNSNPAPDGGAKADALFLPAHEITLAQLLKAAGYTTGMVGKWHLGHQKTEYLPTQRGFDQYVGIPYSNDMRPVHLVERDKVIEYPVVQATLTKRYTEWAVRFIENNKDRPFFLYFAHLMPHKPLACSEAFYHKSGAGLYGDVMAELDWSVHQVLAKLKELGLDDNTLVVFTSDNGPWYGGSAGGLRGMKGTTWEGGYRVPCIVRWPGHVPAGKQCDEAAVMMDLFATALSAAKVEKPRERVSDGQDLLPLLNGKADRLHDVVFGQSGPRVATVRDNRWKLHLVPARSPKEAKRTERWIDPRGPDGVTILAPYEQYQPSDYPGLRSGDNAKALSLFDLKEDPGEQRDVAGQHADVVARLKAKYDELVKEFPSVADASAAPPEGGRPLFDGKTLAGWHALPRVQGKAPKDGKADKDSFYARSLQSRGKWTVEDGVLIGAQDPPGSGLGGYLVSDEAFGDFELLIDAKPDWAVDTGVLVRTTPEGNVGYQILIDHRRDGGIGGFYGNGLAGFHAIPYCFTARRDDRGQPIGLREADPKTAFQPVTEERRRLLTYAAPVADFMKAWKFGDWNTFKIRCEGELPRLTTWINGTKICAMDVAKIEWPGFDKTAVAARLGRRGHIALEVHSNGPMDRLGQERWAPGAVCRWRNIYIRPLAEAR